MSAHHFAPPPFQGMCFGYGKLVHRDSSMSRLLRGQAEQTRSDFLVQYGPCCPLGLFLVLGRSITEQTVTSDVLPRALGKLMAGGWAGISSLCFISTPGAAEHRLGGAPHPPASLLYYSQSQIEEQQKPGFYPSVHADDPSRGSCRPKTRE